jgi:lipid-A-disaccharide synthase
MPCDLFVFAGEKSGDLHGEKLLLALLAQNPALTIAGVGGPRMRALGIDCILPMEEFQVMGFVDVFLALPKLIHHFYFVASEVQRLSPKAVITIDYPGFNLRLARHLRKKGFRGKLIHFICPSVWAWGKKRIPLMAKHLDLLLSILPFEKELFKETSLRVSFVGHPLSERLKSYTCKTMPLGGKILALFPGSRKKEILRNLPTMLDVCKDLLTTHPDLKIALSVSDEKFRPLILQIAHKKGWTEGSLLLVPAEKSYELMKAAFLAIAKSGTVTLELAMHRVPTVVVYAVSCLDKIIAWNILRIRLTHYCLVNIIAGREIFPELIGPNCTREKIKTAATALLDEPARVKMQTACDALLDQFGTKETSTEAAREILNLTSGSHRSTW